MLVTILVNGVFGIITLTGLYNNVVYLCSEPTKAYPNTGISPKETAEVGKVESFFCLPRTPLRAIVVNRIGHAMKHVGWCLISS